MSGLTPALRAAAIAGADAQYLLYDNFGGCNLDPAKWLPVDTGSHMSVSAGQLAFDGGLVAPAHGNPMAESIPSFGRPAWVVAQVKANTTTGLGPYLLLAGVSPLVTFVTDAEYDLAFGNLGGGCIRSDRLGVGRNQPLYSVSTWYWFLIILRATGADYFFSTDGRWFWRLWNEPAGTTSPLFFVVETYSQAGKAELVWVRQGTAPGAILSGTPAALSLSLGAELDSGNLVVGNWYQITATQANYFYTGCAIGHGFRAAATTALNVNNKVKLIALASTHVLLGDAGTKHLLADYKATSSAGYDDGVYICGTADQSYELIARTNGTNVRLEKVEAGVSTVPIDTATGVTYAAGRIIRILTTPIEGSASSSVAVYYQSTAGASPVQIGTTQTIDLTNYGTLAGRFGTQDGSASGLQEVWGGVAL